MEDATDKALSSWFVLEVDAFTPAFRISFARRLFRPYESALDRRRCVTSVPDESAFVPCTRG